MSNIERKVKFVGTTVELQTMTIVVPTLNFIAYRDHQALEKLNMVIDELKATEATGNLNLSREAIDNAIELVWLSAVRNYPDITIDDIAEGLDIDNIGQILPKLVSKNSVDAVKEETEKNV